MNSVTDSGSDWPRCFLRNAHRNVAARIMLTD